jgi:hypothetical protein
MDKDLPFEEEWISNNESIRVFKSDVFSFGLVILYVILFKKFTSKERI